MMKRVLAGLLAVLIILSFSAFSFAAELLNPGAPRVADRADIFSSGEEEALELRIRELIDEFGYDIVIYTDDDNQGKTIEQGADDFYDDGAYGTLEDMSGCLLYICFDPDIRAWWHSTCGACISLFDYNNINIIDDAMESFMLSGDFFEAANVYLDCVGELFEKGSLYDEGSHTHYDGDEWTDYDPHYDDETSRAHDMTPLETAGGIGIVALAISSIAGLIAKARANASMHTVGIGSRADEYEAPGSFRLDHAENIFLYMNVMRTPRAQDPPHNSGGGMHSGGSSASHVHISSGGASHGGGGGRHF